MNTNLGSYPDFNFEERLWKKGLLCVAGCDEVGRGCFAGPVVAGACVFPPKTISTFKGTTLQGIRIDDSKRLTALQREKADEWIRENCLAYGVGVGNIAEINRFGIKKTTDSAFRRAVYNANKTLSVRLEYLLIDAFYIPYIRGIRMPIKTKRLKNRRTQKLKNRKILRQSSGKAKKQINYGFYGNQLAVEKGDQKSFSIAAASIIAKVYRDKLMVELSKEYKEYRWDKNKGYGTKEHQNAILENGITRHHRKAFVETFMTKRNLT